MEKREGCRVKGQNIIQTIPLDKLIANPLNANRMSEVVFKKLLRNIERTGRYEPIVVRTHPEIDGSFEIINGHHRLKVLVELGYETAECVVWDVNDNEAALLLASLNRLVGSDVLEKKIELLSKLREDFSAAELAKLLPHTKGQIEGLLNLQKPILPTGVDKGAFAVPLVFYVNEEQLNIIDKAITHIIEDVKGGRAAERKSNALARIAEEWMKDNT